MQEYETNFEKKLNKILFEEEKYDLSTCKMTVDNLLSLQESGQVEYDLKAMSLRYMYSYIDTAKEHLRYLLLHLYESVLAFEDHKTDYIKSMIYQSNLRLDMYIEIYSNSLKEFSFNVKEYIESIEEETFKCALSGDDERYNQPLPEKYKYENIMYIYYEYTKKDEDNQYGK